MPNQLRRSYILDQLEASGRRITPQRTTIIDAMVEYEGHPTPMDVRDRVWQKDPSISQATVYNTIAVLAELGVIRKFDLADDENAHYDIDVRAHVNIVCSSCGRITDVHTDTLEALLGLVAMRSGYNITPGAITVYGTCASCAAKQAA